MSLQIVPTTLKLADSFVLEHHRHHPPARRHRWSIGVADDGRLCGVAIAARPKSRHLDNGLTLEVVRVATDGTRNACSKLYGAVARAARAMGYQALLTYTLDYESGSSLRAVGWHRDGDVPGRSWDTPTRPRVDKHPTTPKVRWTFQFTDPGPATPSPVAGPVSNTPTSTPTENRETA